MDMNYLKSIKDIKSRIKSSYSCNQERCQMMRDRLDRHVKEHHSSAGQLNTLDGGTQGDKVTKDLLTCGTHDGQHTVVVPSYFDARDEQTTISRKQSSTELETETCGKFCVSFTNSVQSDFVAADLISSIYNLKTVESMSITNHNCEVNSAQTNFNDITPDFGKYDKCSESSLKDFFNDVVEKSKSQSNYNIQESVACDGKETIEVLSLKKEYYKEKVQEEVYKWLQDIPICTKFHGAVKSDKEYKINALINEIHMISEIDEVNYEEILKLTISKFLDNFPIGTLHSEHKHVSYNENYSIKLLQRIKNITHKQENINEHIQSHYINIGPDNGQSSTHISKTILKNEIKNWLAKIKWKNDHIKDINFTEQIVDRYLNRLSDLLNEPNNSKMYKLTLEGEIVELLLDLSINFKHPKHKMIHINTLAEELTNKLLNILRHDRRYHTHDRIQKIALQETTNEILGFRPNENYMKNEFMKIIKNVLTTNDIPSNIEIEEVILEHIIENIKIINNGNPNDLEDIIYGSICKYTNITELQVAKLVKTITMEIKSVAQNGVLYKKPTTMLIQPRLSGVISVYNTEEKFKMFTSTPKKKKKSDEEIPKLNPEQISCMEKLTAVVKDWMKSLPIHFDKTEDAVFKDTIISDLAGNLMYAIRYDQIVVGLKTSDKRFVVQDKESTLKDIIFLWLNRYGIFDDRQKCTKEIEDLYSKVNKIPVPVLTRPQHGTRQTIAKTAWLEGEDYYDNYEYIPKGIHILEDNISMWMNEQSDIFAYEDHSMRGRMVKALAGDIQERLVGKHTDKELMDDIGCWLDEIVKPENKRDIPDLIEELKNRIKNIPQDITLDRRYMEKMYEIYHKWLAKQNPQSNESATFHEDFLDPNGTMKEYIGKFIQKNCNTDDPITRKVFAYTLKEFLKLSPDARKDIYHNSGEIKNNQIFSIERFANELEYIKILSDWLNTLPIDSNYKILRNKHRIEFIHNLAKYFVEIEDERAKSPNAMDYDAYLMSIIASNTVYLPLPNEQKIYLLQSASSLLKKLDDYRKKRIKSYTKPAITTANLGFFIEKFVKEYGQDVLDDPLKLEVWMDRLTQEVQNIARDTADPMLLEKTQIYNKLVQVPYPGEDSVALFGLQLECATEIMDWLKNLPLKKDFNESEEQLLVSMISDLADRIIDRRIRKLDNPQDVQEDTETVEFIKSWIFRLPLETQDEIVIPIVIQQLMNRIDRAKNAQVSKAVNDINQTTEKSDQVTDKIVKTKSPHNSKTYKSSPENAILEAVDKFCKALPMQTNDNDVAKATKDEIAKKLLQKISKLNIDPTIFNDELLFKEMFRDEVDMVLEHVPQNIVPQKNIEKLKKTLIDSIVEIESVIKEQSAGENYKQKLENTIEASIPNPVQMSQIYDPGFEFYKNRLATMFILQNFDHADEDIKLKYEKRIQAEVDKYFEYAQNRNAIPLSKDRIQNELYSVLFKVPMPNEASVVGEVEEAKTRFEIDAWYELLPLIPTNNLDELLEREKILSTLAKRIHDLEKIEKNDDPVIRKEIMKWLSKLPILPGYSRNIAEFANQLQKRLKSTSKERKCVLKETQREKGKVKRREKIKSDKNFEESKLRTQDVNNTKKQSTSVEKQRLYSLIPIVPQKPAADFILEAVETWCRQLPFPTNDPREAANSRNIKDNLAIHIVLKISELNSDPEIFTNEYEYDMKLDQEIDKLLYNLPLLCDFQSKEGRKYKLKEMIRAIKPLIALEREKHEYKKHLKHTVRSFLEEPHIVDQSKKVKPSKDDVEKIVDNFIEFNCSKDDVEERNVHKIEVHNTVVKHLSNIKENTDKKSVIDPLIIRNELICEMSKVPPPCGPALKDLVEEIRMKNEVNEFFQELGFPKEDETAKLLRNELKGQLTNKLFDLEKNGHNIANESNMKKEIDKCLTKLGKKISPEVIDGFLKKLRSTEISRKATPLVTSSPKGMLPSSPNLRQTLPPIRRSEADAHKLLTPKPTVSIQPSYPPHHDPKRTSKQNELISCSRIIRIPHESVIKKASIHIPSANIQDLDLVINSSMKQIGPVGSKTNSIIGKSNIIQQPAPSEIPVEVVQPELQQSLPSRQVVISQRITSPLPAAVQPPSRINTVLAPTVRLMHTAPVQANARSTPSVPISAPSTILPTRLIADPSVRDSRPTQAPQSRVPSRRRRDPESELPDERDKGCTCSSRNRVRKRKRVCIRGTNFCDDFDFSMPAPLMWCGMGQPFLVFY